MTKPKSVATAKAVSRRLSPLVVVIVVVALLVAGGAWYRFVWASPEQVFWSMVDNSLNTQGVVRQTSQSNNGQTTNEKLILTLGKSPMAHDYMSVARQAKEGTTTIKYELVGTKTSDYARYTAITLPSSTKNQPDFSPVINVWGTTDAAPGDNLKQAMLGVVPFANLDTNTRHKLVSQLKSSHVYGRELPAPQKQHTNGTFVYVYGITINGDAYAKVLQQYAKAAQLGTLTDIDLPPCLGESLTVKLTVDVSSRTLTSVEYPKINCTQTYHSHSGTQHWTAPAKSIPLTQLEERLQSLQQKQ